MKKNQYIINKEIEALIDSKDANGEKYTKKDVEFLQLYEGYGGLAKYGAKGREILDEFFTPNEICELMVNKASEYGYSSGNVLEPSCGPGRIIKYLKPEKVTAFEISKYSLRIAQETYPKAMIYPHFFETAFLQPQGAEFGGMMRNKVTWLEGYPFDLVIGNPPYGQNNNFYSGRLKKGRQPKFKQLEIAFMYYGIRMLKKDGLMVYLTARNFMSNGLSYETAKDVLFQYCDLIDAYRLPSVFRNSDVPTDILIFRKK